MMTSASTPLLIRSFSFNDADEVEKWTSFFDIAFAKDLATTYATLFAQHHISSNECDVLTDAEFHEMGIPIGHRKYVNEVIMKVKNAELKAQTHDHAVTGAMDQTVVVGSLSPARQQNQWKPHESSLKLDNGYEWIDYHGEAPTLEGFLQWVECSLLEANALPKAFMRGFLDNKPMSFVMNSTGGSKSLILLRLPSVALMNTPTEVKETTVATLTNRFVVIFHQKKRRILSFHRDLTNDLPWLKNIKTEWSNYKHMEEVAFLASLLSEASQPARDVLLTWRTRFDQLSNVRISKFPVQITALLSRAQQQSQVVKRCLRANLDVLEELGDRVGTAVVKPLLQFVRDQAQAAEELETNAMDAINLRIGLVGFRAQENMKLFTYISAIVSPLTVMTGWYGMNFQHMPELPEENAYWIFIACAGAVVIGMMFLLWYLQRIPAITPQQMLKMGITDAKKSAEENPLRREPFNDK